MHGAVSGAFRASGSPVADFFGKLHGRDPSAETWLAELLALPRGGSGVERPTSAGTLQDYGWGASARELHPPASLLAWRVRGLKCPSAIRAERDGTPGCASGAEALALAGVGGSLPALDVPAPDSTADEDEGPQRPDAYLATSDAVVLVMGGEPGATAAEAGAVGVRLLRLLDAALELAGPRSLWGLLMVGASAEGGIPDVWIESCREVLRPDRLHQLLAHRPPDLREAIGEALLGVVTWEEARSRLDVAPDD